MKFVAPFGFSIDSVILTASSASSALSFQVLSFPVFDLSLLAAAAGASAQCGMEMTGSLLMGRESVHCFILEFDGAFCSDPL